MRCQAISSTPGRRMVIVPTLLRDEGGMARARRVTRSRDTANSVWGRYETVPETSVADAGRRRIG